MRELINLVENLASPPLEEMVRQVQVGSSDPMHVIENPSRAQMTALLQKVQNARCIIDKQDNLWVWEARRATHSQMMDALGLTTPTIRLGGMIHDSCLSLAYSEAQVERWTPEIEQIKSLQRALGPGFTLYSSEW